jgi:actin-related protein
MAGALEGDTFIGRRAQEYRGLLKIKYPIEHGIVTDWDDMERIWNWVYTEELGTLSEEVRAFTATRLGLLITRGAASCTTDRGTIKPAFEPRRRGTNILRYF